MEILNAILITPIHDMISDPGFFIQTLWEGLVSGILYTLIALGFVLIYKSSGIFNFAQGIMVVFAALSLVFFYHKGLPAWLALIATLLLMAALAYSVERVVLRPLVNQPDIILFMATIGLTYFLIGFGEFIFGGEVRQMITEQLGIPTDSYSFEWAKNLVILEQRDITAVVGAVVLVGLLLGFLSYTATGRALRAVADDHQAAMSIGISLHYIWFIVWFVAGVIGLATGIVWGAKAGVSFALEVIAYKALPVLMLGGLTSVPGAIIGGLIIGLSEKLFEIYWGQPLLGGGTESWFAYVLALLVLLFRPQGLFGEKIIERV